jgi:sterol desaturase/sphingolipid hydroxylase (fatty acid hydroxylase superfamily)
MRTWLDMFRRTKREYYADFFITTPITAAVLILSFVNTDLGSFAWQFSLGALIWSAYEYIVHRWVLHETPGFRELHQMHHLDQLDYIAIHPAATVAFYLLFWTLFGFSSTNPLMAGFSTAYVVYSALHTAFHYARIAPGHPLYYLKRIHAIHHQIDVNYGVTSPLWDIVFGTYCNKRNKK